LRVKIASILVVPVVVVKIASILVVPVVVVKIASILVVMPKFGPKRVTLEIVSIVGCRYSIMV
jgi:hypothetical protein